MGLLDVLKGVGTFAGDVTTGLASVSSGLPAAMQTRYQNQLAQQQLEQRREEQRLAQERERAKAENELQKSQFDLMKYLRDVGATSEAIAVHNELVEGGFLPRTSGTTSWLTKPNEDSEIAEVSEKYGGFFLKNRQFVPFPDAVIARAVLEKPGRKQYDPIRGVIVDIDTGTFVDLGDSFRALRNQGSTPEQSRQINMVFSDLAKRLDEAKLTPEQALQDASLQLTNMGVPEDQKEAILKNFQVSFDSRAMGLNFTAKEEQELGEALDVQEKGAQIIQMLTEKPELRRSLGRIRGSIDKGLAYLSGEGTRSEDEIRLLFALENLRDVGLTRQRSGATMTENEQKFYTDLIGGQLSDPDAVITRLDELINQEQLKVNSAYKNRLRLRYGGVVPPELEKRIPSYQKGYDLSGVKTVPETVQDLLNDEVPEDAELIEVE